MKKNIKLLFICMMCVFISGCGAEANVTEQSTVTEETTIQLASIPEFTDTPYVVINDNEATFTEEEMTEEAFEEYSELDDLGRCGETYVNVCEEIMPTEERGNISSVKPTGWQTAEYDIVDGDYLYNRCHLIGFQLSGENANENNLITGTRYCNVEGMLPFENMIADYVEETDNHVLYRVTPVFEEDNLVASGIHMEAKSVEDDGEGLEFNVYCYNVQPGIEIDYATGDSWLSDEEPVESEESSTGSEESTYILNTNSKKFHEAGCSGVRTMKSENKEEYVGSRSDLIADGYEACKTCNP